MPRICYLPWPFGSPQTIATSRVFCFLSPHLPPKKQFFAPMGAVSPTPSRKFMPWRMFQPFYIYLLEVNAPTAFCLENSSPRNSLAPSSSASELRTFNISKTIITSKVSDTLVFVVLINNFLFLEQFQGHACQNWSGPLILPPPSHTAFHTTNILIRVAHWLQSVLSFKQVCSVNLLVCAFNISGIFPNLRSTDSIFFYFQAIIWISFCL